MCARMRSGEAAAAAAAEAAQAAAEAKELWPDAVKAVILSPSHELTAQQVSVGICHGLADGLHACVLCACFRVHVQDLCMCPRCPAGKHRHRHMRRQRHRHVARA